MGWSCLLFSVRINFVFGFGVVFFAKCGVENCKLYENLAKEKRLARLHFLKLRNKSALQDQLAQAQAVPIIAPIVEAIEKTSEAAANKLPLSKEDLRKMFLQLQKHSLKA